MQISYQLSLDDIIAFNIDHISHNPKSQTKLRRNRIIIPFIYAVVAAGLLVLNSSFWPVSWFFGFLALLWAIFYPAAWKQRVQYQVKKTYKNVDFDSDEFFYELELKREGVDATNPSHSAFIPWDKIITISNTDSHLFLYFSLDNGMIIPKASIEEDTPWPEIVTKIIELHESAKSLNN